MCGNRLPNKVTNGLNFFGDEMLKKKMNKNFEATIKNINEHMETHFES